jgi:pantoate--beta-alanine ligase
MICQTQTELQHLLQNLKREANSLGFVPTMGALHTGHISLIEQALHAHKIVVVSIFVNPTQFNNSEDLSKYPRTLNQDIELIKAFTDFSRVIVFAPEPDEVYGSQTTAKQYSFGVLDQVMEGANRPGHFNGVGTVLDFLFNLIAPDKAYFGEKDFQQLQVVKSLVKQLNLPLQIIGCPIKREPNMLAMSSRNERLSSSNRQKAGVIYQSLVQAKKLYHTSTLHVMYNYINSFYRELNEFDLEYFVVSNERNLIALEEKTLKIPVRAFIVVRIEGVRLIDNLSLN